jgi:hypothetical protein
VSSKKPKVVLWDDTYSFHVDVLEFHGNDGQWLRYYEGAASQLNEKMKHCGTWDGVCMTQLFMEVVV